MAIRNQNWYDRNSSRAYPLDESATLIDDDGNRLPHDLIVDLQLRFPESLGNRAYLAALTVTPNLVSLTILSSGAGFNAVASFSQSLPLDANRFYELEAKEDGAGGWIAFGDDINDVDTLTTYRFSNATQSLFTAQTARRYAGIPLTSLGKLHSVEALSGIVKLQGGNDLETVKESREIEGVVRDVAVLRLVDETEAGGNNLLETYAGDCGRRPESGNCGEPNPIEYINTVPPDCCGNIFMEFRGCADLSQIAEQCGVIVNCGFGLSEACISEKRLPDPTGKLPNEYDDLCEDEDGSSAIEDTIGENLYVEQDRTPSGLLPYEEGFHDLIANGFSAAQGTFVISAGGNGSGSITSIVDSGGDTKVTLGESPAFGLPSTFTITGNSVSAYNTTHSITLVESSKTVVTDQTYTSNGTGGEWEEVASGSGGAAGVVYESQEDSRAIAIWNGGAIPTDAGWDCLHKKIEVILSLKPGYSGGNRNGGVVFNYKAADNVYWMVEIDWDNNKTFRLVRILDGVKTGYGGAVTVSSLDTHKRYKITIEILPMNTVSDSAYVKANLYGFDDGVDIDIGPAELPDYKDASGFFGFHSNRAVTWFESMVVDHHNP